MSIIFCPDPQTLQKGAGRGRGFFATNSLSKLHMLSYVMYKEDHCCRGTPSTIFSRQFIKQINTWLGDSALYRVQIESLLKSHNYNSTITVSLYVFVDCFVCCDYQLTCREE